MALFIFLLIYIFLAKKSLPILQTTVSAIELFWTSFFDVDSRDLDIYIPGDCTFLFEMFKCVHIKKKKTMFLMYTFTLLENWGSFILFCMLVYIELASFLLDEWLFRFLDCNVLVTHCKESFPNFTSIVMRIHAN